MGAHKMSLVIVNQNITYSDEQKKHEKASERYVVVTMRYPNGKRFEGWVPIEYRRTGLDLKTPEEISSYLTKIYDYLNPDNDQKWINEADDFFAKERPNAGVTKKVFDAIKSGKWICVNCSIHNPNWARRFQELKEMGFTFATQTPVNCPVCKTKSTYIMALHLPRYLDSNGNGYETWSPALRKRILSLLNSYDAYEGKTAGNLLPDHKFSEIRWDDKTKSENPDSMTDIEIKDKFQLLSNQRNQQKREVCRQCAQTGKRPSIFGIYYFVRGGKNWDPTIPEKGKEAEEGCMGCPWYDIEAWRKNIQKELDALDQANQSKDEPKNDKNSR
jgi:hypothetical protein